MLTSTQNGILQAQVMACQLKCYGRIYVKFKEEWRRIDEKNENKGRKIHDERFPDNFQATFTSQLVEIGIGFIDCKIFFCPILN